MTDRPNVRTNGRTRPLRCGCLRCLIKEGKALSLSLSLANEREKDILRVEMQ